MSLATYNDLLKEQVKDVYSAETQLVDALPKLIEAASHPDLKHAFEHHLKETHGHVERLRTASLELGFSTEGETCNAMAGLISEAEEIINQTGQGDVKDAALIAAAQRVEHYEIAAYGTLCHLLSKTDNDQAKGLLLDTLAEEKSADATLNDLATGHDGKTNIVEGAATS